MKHNTSFPGVDTDFHGVFEYLDDDGAAVYLKTSRRRLKDCACGEVGLDSCDWGLQYATAGTG